MASLNSKIDLAKTDFKAACKYIESGVEIEENEGNAKDAITFYRNGIKLLDKALGAPSMKSGLSYFISRPFD